MSKMDLSEDQQVIRQLQQSLDQVNASLSRLSGFLEQADARACLIKSAGDLDVALSTAVSDLRENTLKQVESVRQASVRLDAALSDVVSSLQENMKDQLQSFQSQQTALSKLNQLDRLDELIDTLTDIKKIMQNGNNQINFEVAQLAEQISKMPRPPKNSSFGVSPKLVEAMLIFMVIGMALGLLAFFSRMFG